MFENEIIRLRYQHAGLVASPNTSNGQREDSRTILDLIDHIEVLREELRIAMNKLTPEESS